MGQMDRALGHPNEMARLIDGRGDFNRPAVGHSNVLAGKADEAPRNVEGVLAALQHAGQPVDCSVGVAVAHGFVQRRNEIVVLFSVLIVEQRLFRKALLQDFRPDHHTSRSSFAVQHGHFQGVQRRARIAVCKICDHRQHVPGYLDGFPAETAGVRKRMAQERLQVLRGQRLQHEDFAAGEKRRIDFKRRVFGRRADQDDAAALDKWEESILLRLVKAVNLIDK